MYNLPQPGPDGALWFGGSDGLLRLDRNGLERAGLSGAWVIPVAVTEDHVWFRSGGGFYRMAVSPT